MVLEESVDPMPKQQQHQQCQTDAMDEEPEPVIEVNTSGNFIFDKTYDMMELFSSTLIGQSVLRRGDHLLSILENTAKWGLPQVQPPVVPLSWLPFLLLILLMRSIRSFLSLGALLIGNGPVTARSVVYFIQTRRRKLRSVRMHGLKAIQQREEEHKATLCNHDNLLVVRLGKLFHTAICRPRINNKPEGIVFSIPKSDKQELRQPIESSRSTLNKRRREEDTPEAQMCSQDLLTQYANEDSDDDPDYVPTREEEVKGDDTNHESTISANTSNATQEYIVNTSGENVKNQSFTEKEDVKVRKSPKEENVPIMEINLEEAGSTKNQSFTEKDDVQERKSPKEENVPTIEINLGNTSTPIKDHNDKKSVTAENDEKITKPPQTPPTPPTPHTPHTPLDNGQSKSGKGVEPGEEAVVVQTQAACEVTKPQSETFLNILNGHNNEQKKATPGHESAAHTKPQLPTPLLGSVVGNANPSDGKLIDANDACSDNPIEIPTNTPVLPPTSQQQPLSSPSALSSPSCSITSFTSSLASLVASDNFVVDVDRSDPPTPTPSLNTASSTEDIYLSPFGSPPNFNTLHNPSTSQQSTSSKLSEIEADISVEESDEQSQHAKKPQTPSEHKSRHKQQHKQAHYQRYRRNRR